MRNPLGILAALAIASFATTASAAPPNLFETSSTGAVTIHDSQNGPASIDIAQARTSLLNTNALQSPEINFNLFGDVGYVFRNHDKRTVLGDEVWSGTLVSDDKTSVGDAFLVTRADGIYGSVKVNKRAFRVFPFQGKALIAEFKAPLAPPEIIVPGLDIPADVVRVPPGTVRIPKDIDVLVVRSLNARVEFQRWVLVDTGAGKEWYRESVDSDAFIEAAIARAATVLWISGASHGWINLVGIEDSLFDESSMGMVDALRAFTIKDPQGLFANIQHDSRNALKADLVLLWSNYRACDTAWLFDSGDPTPSKAFAVAASQNGCDEFEYSASRAVSELIGARSLSTQFTLLPVLANRYTDVWEIVPGQYTDIVDVSAPAFSTPAGGMRYARISNYQNGTGVAYSDANGNLTYAEWNAGVVADNWYKIQDYSDNL